MTPLPLVISAADSLRNLSKIFPNTQVLLELHAFSVGASPSTASFTLLFFPGEKGGHKCVEFIFLDILNLVAHKGPLRYINCCSAPETGWKMPELSVTLFVAVCLTLRGSASRCTSKVRRTHWEEGKDRERKSRGKRKCITLHANVDFSVVLVLGLTGFIGPYKLQSYSQISVS